VYDFYAIAADTEKSNLSINTSLLRLVAITSRDLTKEGHKSVNDAWDKFEKQLKKSNKNKKRSKETQKIQTDNQAANSILDMISVTPIKRK